MTDPVDPDFRILGRKPSSYRTLPSQIFQIGITGLKLLAWILIGGAIAIYSQENLTTDSALIALVTVIFVYFAFQLSSLKEQLADAKLDIAALEGDIHDLRQTNAELYDLIEDKNVSFFKPDTSSSSLNTQEPSSPAP